MIQRSKNLDEDSIGKIEGILDGWRGQLSWALLIEAVEKRLHQRYTRQALDKHPRVRQAFRLRKKELAERSEDVQPQVVSLELQMALQRIERLESENMRLKGHRDALLDQFARWAYNAHLRSIGIEELNAPLPQVKKDQTSDEMIRREQAKKRLS